MFNYRTVLIIFLFQLATLAFAEDETARCYISVKSKPLIRLRFMLPQDGSNMGLIKYEQGNGYITLERIKETVLPPKKVVPAHVLGTYNEIINNKVTGQYFLFSIGALSPELTYRNYKTKKTIKFYETISKTNPVLNRCDWE